MRAARAPRWELRALLLVRGEREPWARGRSAEATEAERVWVTTQFGFAHRESGVDASLLCLCAREGAVMPLHPEVTGDGPKP